uniref:RNA-directed DNA polymerase n=1 Tax=Panagrolaimus davidi TaxID=227884 RepID=A0A914QA85_9BILA
MVNFFHRYVDRFAEIAAPLTRLLKKNAEFVWTEEQQNAFTQLIKALTSPPILRGPDFQKIFFIFADASLIAIGGAVMQKYGESYFPVSYCSRCLTTSERNYSASEIELLAIVFTLRRHHSILYGHKIHIKTDHRPLTHLETKLSTSTRLNRWLVDLMDYDIQGFTHISGRFNVIADGLSRAKTTIETNATEAVDNYKRLREATAAELKQVVEYVKNNWLHYVDDATIRPYFLVREDLEFKNDVLYKNRKVVIPPSMQNEILKFIHRSHFGLEKTKMHARSHFWFPRMTQLITATVQTCHSCNVNAKINPKKFCSTWPAAEKNWSRVHIDFAGPFLGHMWLIIIDSRSKYPFVIKMIKTTAAATIKALDSVFTLVSYPDFVISDNGPQLTSAELKSYFENHKVQHKFTPPYHPSSNGLAERFVGIFKDSVKKMRDENPKLNVDIAVANFLEDYRNIPHTTTGMAPSIMLFNRYSTNSIDTYRPKYTAQKQPTKFKIYDLVYRRTFTDKKHKWKSSTIMKVQGNYVYWCRDDDATTIRVHENDLKIRLQ